MSKPLKEDYIIRIKSRIEQHIDEPLPVQSKNTRSPLLGVYFEGE